MNVSLADYESATRYAGDYEADLRALQSRLEQIQVAYITQKRRAVIAVEGWDAAGKGGIIRRLTAAWDPRWFEVWPIGAPSADEASQHFLHRFWAKLPGPGSLCVFDRTWYGRVLVERVEGLCRPDEWQRAYDEINAFEAQLVDAGTRVIKIFLHVTQAEQDARLKARLLDPWKRWKTGAEDFRNRSQRPAYLEAYADMFALCNTRWAPWTVIDGNAKKAARIAVLQSVADQLSAGVDMSPPPPDFELERLAALAFALSGPGTAS
ncbi:MAG: polyphosphate kinase 2 family protein [Chakrabartia sp.]